MTAEERSLLKVVLLSLTSATKIEQVDSIWSVVEAMCRKLNIAIGDKPKSVPQAKSMAIGLLNRLGN